MFSQPFTTNWHHYGISPETFEKYLKPFGMKALSRNEDLDGLPFIRWVTKITTLLYWHKQATKTDNKVII